MEMSAFALELWVSRRLSEARAASARRALVAWARPSGPGVLARIGLALIRIERRRRPREGHSAASVPLLGLP